MCLDTIEAQPLWCQIAQYFRISHFLTSSQELPVGLGMDVSRTIIAFSAYTGHCPPQKFGGSALQGASLSYTSMSKASQIHGGTYLDLTSVKWLGFGLVDAFFPKSF